MRTYRSSIVVVLHRYFRRKELSESLDIRKDAEEMDAHEVEEDFSGSLCPGFRQKLWEILEKPASSLAARIFGTISMAFVIISIANMALISVELSWLPPHFLDIVECVCITWFTGEFVLRFLCARNRYFFMRNIANIIDLLAILPFYITLTVESLYGRHSSQELENMGRIVQVLRLLRGLRMLKLGRHSTGKSIFRESFLSDALFLLYSQEKTRIQKESTNKFKECKTKTNIKMGLIHQMWLEMVDSNQPNSGSDYTDICPALGSHWDGMVCCFCQ